MSEDAHNWLFVTAEYVNGSYLVREHSEDAAELARGIMGKWDEAAAEIARMREALDCYMAAFGQALETHGIPYGDQQRTADERARAALARTGGDDARD